MKTDPTYMERSVIAALRGGVMKAPAIAMELGVDVRTVRNALRWPVKAGLVKQLGAGAYEVVRPPRAKAAPVQADRAEVFRVARVLGTRSSNQIAANLGVSRGFVVRAFQTPEGKAVAAELAKVAA